MSDIEDVQKRNAELLGELTAAGFALDETTILKLRLDAITNHLIEAGVIQETTLELNWEMTMSELLEAAAAEVRRRTLLGE
jgi:hypothetical protein